MKLTKTLLAGAILACVGGTAVAETQVTLYGLIDLGVTYQRGKVGTDAMNRATYGGDYHSRIGMNSGIQSGSRWGMRGTEDLGDGLQAVFVLESGFEANNGNRAQGNRLFGRQATVGLKSETLGQVDLGRQTNIASKYFSAIDPFALGYLNSTMGSAFSAANTVRYDNMAMYQTPTWNGFQAGVGYSFNVDDVNRPGGFKTGSKNHAVTTGLRYNHGPLDVVFSYDQQFLNPDQPQPKQAILGAAYDFEVLKLSLAYGWGKDGVMSGQEDLGFFEGLANPNTPAKGMGTTENAFTWKGLQINSYLVGLSAPIGGASNVFGSWQRAAPNKGLEDMDIYSVGYTYDLSKRTNLYSVASYVDGAAFVEGNRMMTVGVGVRHRF